MTDKLNDFQNFTLGTTLMELEQRKEITSELLKKYPGKVPIICQTSTYSKLLPLTKNKYILSIN